MTFSIVAYDPDTDEIGVAVQSKAFSVGSIVPFAKAGVGAVATQSLANVSLGPLGIELMSEGRSPQQVLEHFREIDKGIEYRQLGILSIKHGALSFSGDQCIPSVGNVVGDNYACQGNLLANENVVSAMGKAFENAKGPLAKRMIAALRAGQNAGGDARGRQSAAIIIEQPGKGRAGFGDRKIDLRVEDHENPIEELDRVLDIRLMNIKLAELVGYEDVENAIEELKRAIEGRTDRVMDEAWLTLGSLYFKAGDLENAKKCIDTCLNIAPGMISIVEAYPKLGIGFDDEFVKQFR